MGSDVPRGYSATAGGFRAWVRVASKKDHFNEIRAKRFPSTATKDQIRSWRDRTRTQLRAQLADKRQQTAAITGMEGGFRSEAVTRYLPAVQAMPTYEQRVKDILRWAEEFGDRDPLTIEAYEIRAVRDRWLTVGPKRKLQKINGTTQWIDVAEPLSASSVNHRLRALSNFFTVLYPQTPNPVHAVPEANEPAAIPRGYDYATIQSILDAMADLGRPTKGEKRSTESLAKVRARVMAWAGLEPTELGRISEQDILDAIESGVLYVPGRRKGEGAAGRLMPLNQDAIDALRDLVRLKATGPFRSRGVLRAWQKACVKVLGRTLRLKDLRHSFVTNIIRATKDLKLAQMLAGHEDHRTTQRYGLAALLPMLRAGVDASFPPEKEKDK